MINAVTGSLVYVGAQSVTVFVSGIEYELIISSQTATKLSNLQGSDRNNVRILTYLQHKEDSMTLFGFNDEDERRLFLELIKVNGIGPKQAMKILSGVRVSDFISALDSGDVNFLSKIPGLGAKTSQKIILALRDTLVFTSESSLPKNIGTSASHKYEDIIEALVEMGYEKRKVLECISKLLSENEAHLKDKSESAVEEYLFRNAIVMLG